MVGRAFFGHNHIRRQSRAPKLMVKSLNRFDHSATVTVPLIPCHPTDKRGDASKENKLTTVPRSAYSVLRRRNRAPNTCAQKMIPSVVDPASANMDKCCCTALLYCADKRVTPQLTVEEERDRDDFVFALKLAGVETLLRDLVGEERYAMLVGHALTKAQQVGLCQDLSHIVACTNDSDDGDHADMESPWVARLLLTPEEDNRIRWLREDDGHASTVFARVPSFKAMYAVYHIGLHASVTQQPTERDLKAIEDRMRDNREEWDMTDAAVIATFALRNDALGPFFCHVVCHVLLEESVSVSTALASSSLTRRDAQLRHVLAALLIHKCARRLCGEAQRSEGHIGDPPTYLLSAVSQLFRVAAALRQDQTAEIVTSLTRSCSETVLALSAQCIVPAESPQLPDFTLWLLREAASSASCRLHFSRMVQRSHSEALALLDRSGLLLTRAIDLSVFVGVVLPLLDSTGSEEFFFLAIREVLAGLEERLRGGAKCFTAEDMRCIAMLGTRLCDTPTQGNAHDFALCGQLEELSVMDGSPWALVTFSYSSLKEILRALVRDHRRLKRQMQTQVRNIVEAVTAHTTESAPTAAPAVDLSMQHSVEKGFNKAPASASTSTAKISSPALSSPASGVDNESRIRLSTPPLLRERFIIFVENLVKGLVDETRRTDTQSMVVNDALYAFVNQHIPIPNIHDEYRRKLFFLVNVSDSSSVISGDVSDGDVSGEGSMKDGIPAELRVLVSSLPLTLSPWASVMILREVLNESAGNNPRYTYVLNAAIDLQLPISTTRSRIATTLNMWRFLNSQSEKLAFNEQVTMKRRCVLNLPFAYILSSYWSLLTWLFLVAIIGLNVVGLDFESQYVATRLFDQFAAPDDVLPTAMDSCAAAGAEEIVSLYLAESPAGEADLPRRTSPEAILSSASSLFLGEEERRYPMTVVRIRGEWSGGGGSRACAVEHACAAAVLRAMSLRLSFPFYVPLEQQLPLDLIIARVAERIRRVSFNHAWFVSRVIFRTFPLGRYQTEYGLVSHTCAQANLTRRRVTFLLHIHHGVALPPALLIRLRESILAHGANLVVIASEESLARGGTDPHNVQGVRWLSHGIDSDTSAQRETTEESAPLRFGKNFAMRTEQMCSRAAEKCAEAAKDCLATCRKALRSAQEWIPRLGAVTCVWSDSDCSMRGVADPFGRAPSALIAPTKESLSEINDAID